MSRRTVLVTRIIAALAAPILTAVFVGVGFLFVAYALPVLTGQLPLGIGLVLALILGIPALGAGVLAFRLWATAIMPDDPRGAESGDARKP